MNRRDLLKSSTALGFAAALPDWARGTLATNPTPAISIPLKPPAQGSIPVAFVVSDGAVVIDFCGPWEVFQDVGVPGREGDAFRLYTVAETVTPIRASGGMKIVPDYTFENAPPPKVIVIPAQDGHGEATLEWIRKSARSADVTMSVCTGAFLLAKTGMLAGKSATTHHDAYRGFAIEHPEIALKRGVRFVEEGTLASAGGLSSGIDLALHVVERYYGRDVAQRTAYEMEYQGEGWMHPESNKVYAAVRTSTDAHPLCAVCDMEADPKTAPT
ncbi:MAG TPA: DJ-1/PfpI family protein, partial [Vicinamibacteria bacterium]|nr:DJ-1/PfpI family protein [Vicinamibacteria bacterium]